VTEKVESNDVEKFTGSYIDWLKEELTGWDTLPWILFGLGTGFQLAILLLGKINWISIVSFVGIFFGQWCTVAMGAGGWREVNGEKVRVSSHAINGLLGSLSVIAYIIVNAQAHHWFSIIDQLFFFFLIDVELMATWRTWGRGKQNEMKTILTFDKLPKSKKLGTKIKHGLHYFKQFMTSKWMLIIPIVLVLWGGLYYVGLLTNDNNPVWDALALAIGATASWLCFRRYEQTFTLWIVSDLVNLTLWFTGLLDGYTQAALPMLAMTVFYFATAIVGRINWKPTKTK